MIQNPYQNLNLYQNPYLNNQMNYNNAMIQPSSLIRVTGIEGARAYQMSANSQVALFDNNEDMMYIKVTDGAGFPTIRIFRFKEVTEATTTNKDESYISRDEFESYKKEVEDYVQHIIQQSSTTTKSKSASNDKQSTQN